MAQVSQVTVTWTPITSGRVQSIQIQSRIVGSGSGPEGGWTEQAAAMNPAAGSFVFLANAPGAQIECRIRSRMQDGVFSQWIGGNVATGDVVVGWGQIGGAGKPSDGATVNWPGDHMVGNAYFAAPLDTAGKMPCWTVEQSYPGTVTRQSVATDVYVARFDGSSSIRSNPIVTVGNETLYWRLQYRLIRGRLGTTAPSDTAQIWALIRHFDSMGGEIGDTHMIQAMVSPGSGLVTLTGSVVVPAGGRTARAYFTQDIIGSPSTMARSYCGSIDFDRTAWGADITAQSPRVQFLGDNGRVTNGSFYNTSVIIGALNATNLVPSYTVGTSNVTVTIPTHVRKITGASGPVTLNYGAGSGVVAFNAKWFAYVDDPNLTGVPTPSYQFTTDPSNLLYPGRYHVMSGTAPGSGGSGGGFGGGGGGGGTPLP